MVKIINLGDKKLIVGYNLERYGKDEFDKLKSSDDLINMLNDCKDLDLLTDDDYNNLFVILNYENDIEKSLKFIKEYFGYRDDVDNIVIGVLKNVVLEKQEFLEDVLFERYIKDKTKHKLLPYNYLIFIKELKNKQNIRKNVMMKLCKEYDVNNKYVKFLV